MLHNLLGDIASLHLWQNLTTLLSVEHCLSMYQYLREMRTHARRAIQASFNTIMGHS